MSTQKLAPEKPQIGKRVLIAAIAVSSLALLFVLRVVVLDFDFLVYKLAHRLTILYFLFSWAAAILYLTREEQAAAARAWGILGGFALVPFGWMATPAFFMGIGGGALALRRPKVAGVLMLVGVIMGVVSFYVASGVIVMAEWRPSPRTGFWLFTSPVLAISFLIPGGILALTSRKGQRASKKMAIGAIAALFVLSLWWLCLYLIP